MQATRVQQGNSIDYRPSSAVVAGQVVVEGSMIGVSPVPIAANALGALDLKGVFKVVKANEQIALGASVYWDEDGNPYNGTAGTGCLTTTSTDNIFVGWCLAAAGATDETALVFWSGPLSITNTVHSTLTKAIADPGNGGAIPVTDSGYVNLVTAGTQSRTLANPTFAGQTMLFTLRSGTGSIGITAASPGVNQAGNTVLTFDTPGEFIALVGIQRVGSNLAWRVLANDGVALSTP